MSEQWRLFSGIMLPGETRAALVRTQQDQRGLAVRWIRPENLHITLHFYGDVAAAAAPGLAATLGRELAGCRAPVMRCATFGAFPNLRRPRVTWAGIAGAPPELPPICAAAERAGATVGVPKDSRPYTPHITMGYVRNGVAPDELAAIGRALRSSAPPDDEARPYPTVALIRSVLSRDGSIYTPLATWDLPAI